MKSLTVEQSGQVSGDIRASKNFACQLTLSDKDLAITARGVNMAPINTVSLINIGIQVAAD